MIEEQGFKRKTAPCIYRAGSSQDFHMYPSVSLIVVCAYVVRMQSNVASSCANVQVDVSRFRSLGAAYEGSVLQVHTYLLGFGIFHMNRAQNSCLDSSSTRNCAENHSLIMRKIRARLRGYPRPSALQKSWNSSEKCKLSVSSAVHIYRVFSANQLKNLISNTHMTGDEYLQVGCLSHLYQRENSWLCTWLYICVTADKYLPNHIDG